LFALVAQTGTVSNTILQSASIVDAGTASRVGGIAGENDGLLIGDHTSGSIKGAFGIFGGLVGFNIGTGTVFSCSSSSSVEATRQADVGGLVGDSEGTISASFATGSIKSKAPGTISFLGGLLGYQDGGSITSSYATGSEKGGSMAEVGGLAGAYQDATTSQAYSTGKPAVGKPGDVGGSIGAYSSGTFASTYWDVTTSGKKGAGGHEKQIPGITGLTTSQLQAGLPVGFDPAIWAENPSVNGGFPYLIANPPQ
jgi:hypothetical protein